MAKILSETIDELKKSIEQIDFSENNIGKALKIKDAYERLAKIRFELIRDFEELQEIFPADIELNRTNAFLNNGIKLYWSLTKLYPVKKSMMFT